MLNQLCGLNNERHGEVLGAVKLLPVTLIGKVADERAELVYGVRVISHAYFDRMTRYLLKSPARTRNRICFGLLAFLMAFFNSARL